MRERIMSIVLCLAMFATVMAAPQVAMAGSHQGKAQALSSEEMAEYAQLQAQAEEAGVLEQAGGAETGVGTIVLATIGALVLIGVLAAAAA